MYTVVYGDDRVCDTFATIMVTGLFYYNHKQLETYETISIYGCDRVIDKNRVNGEHRVNGKDRINVSTTKPITQRTFLSNFWQHQHGMSQSTIENSYPSKWSR